MQGCGNPPVVVRTAELVSLPAPHYGRYACALGARCRFLLELRPCLCPTFASGAEGYLRCNQEGSFVTLSRGRLHPICECLHRNRQLWRCLVWNILRYLYMQSISLMRATIAPVPPCRSEWLVVTSRVTGCYH